MTSVGVRELRQNASALLDQVAETGEPIEITNHGRLVARLVPATQGKTTWDQLVASGVLRPGRGDPLDIEPVELPPGSPTLQEILDELRDDR